MEKTVSLFTRSMHDFRKTRCLAVTALLIAMNISLDLLGLSVKIPPNLRIGSVFCAMLPSVCSSALPLACSAVSAPMYWAILPEICPWAPISPGYTLTAMVAGLIWGFWLSPNKPTLPRIIGAKVCINLFCNIGLNTLWLTITGGKAMSVLLAARIPKNILMLPIEIPLAYIVLRQVSRIYQYSFKEN